MLLSLNLKAVGLFPLYSHAVNLETTNELLAYLPVLKVHFYFRNFTWRNAIFILWQGVNYNETNLLSFEFFPEKQES